MAKSLIEMTPQELNSYLIEEYNLGLNVFAFLLWATLFYNPKGKITVSELIDIKEKIKNLKSKIISIIADYESLWDAEYSWDKFYKKSEVDIANVIKTYRAEGIFEYINECIERVDQSLDAKRYGNKQLGSYIKCKNIITTFWILLIKHIKKRIDWGILADLLDWFWERLKFYNLYKIINPKDKISDAEYLRNQFYRNKKYLTGLFYQIMNWSFAGRIPWKRANITVIFGEKSHGHIYHSRLHKAGLCHFVNPEQVLKYEAIIKKIGGQHNKNISIGKSMEQEIVLSNIPLDEMDKIYRYYAFRLYRNNPDLPPLIIFPDLSYLK